MFCSRMSEGSHVFLGPKKSIFGEHYRHSSSERSSLPTSWWAKPYVLSMSKMSAVSICPRLKEVFILRDSNFGSFECITFEKKTHRLGHSTENASMGY